MYRTTKKELLYKKYKRGEKDCYFCNPEPKVVIKKSKDFYIIKNSFPYDFWDAQKVEKHLLVVSKKHISALNSKDSSMLSEYIKLLNKFSKKGFDLFARAPNSPSRTQIHFHTHLIKTEGKKIKSLKYKTKPYSLEVQ